MAAPDQIVGRGLAKTVGLWCDLNDRLVPGGAIKGTIASAGPGREARGSAGREAVAGPALAGALKGTTLVIPAGAEGGTSRRPGAGAAGEAVGGRAVAGGTITAAALTERAIAEGAGGATAIGEGTG